MNKRHLLLLACLIVTSSPVRAFDFDYDELLAKPISIRLVEAAELCRNKEYAQAERRYRKLLNAVQLAKGFGHRDVKPILEGLALALAGLQRNDEAKEAKSLASSIRTGMVPIASNSTAFMRSDESIVVFRRVVAKNAVGGALIELQSGDPSYSATIAMVGGLIPGQAKLLPPISAGSDLDEACGIAYTDKKLMQVFRDFNYRYKTTGGIGTVRLKNKNIDRTARYVQGLELSIIRNAATNPDFLLAYYQDTERLTINERIALAHFLQPGEAGIQETYAWLFVAANENQISEELRPLRKLMPTVFDLVNNDKLAPTLPYPKIET